jgi:hypothetical protein
MGTPYISYHWTGGPLDGQSTWQLMTCDAYAGIEVPVQLPDGSTHLYRQTGYSHEGAERYAEHVRLSA